MRHVISFGSLPRSLPHAFAKITVPFARIASLGTYISKDSVPMVSVRAFRNSLVEFVEVYTSYGDYMVAQISIRS